MGVKLFTKKLVKEERQKSQILSHSKPSLMSNLTILSYNIRSCNRIFNALLAFLEVNSVNFDILILYETRLNDQTSCLYEIPRYSSFSVNRNSYGGGIKVYYHNRLNISIIDEYTGIFDTHESIYFKLNQYKTKQIIFSCIYRPPNKNLKNFLNNLDEIHSTQYFADKQIVLCGDLNCDVSKNNALSRNFLNTFANNGLKQLVTEKTHVDIRSGILNSMIDLVFSNLTSNKLNVEVLECFLSDHFIIKILIKSEVENRIEKIKFRDFSSTNMKKFKDAAEGELSCYSTEGENIEAKFNEFIHLLYSILDKYFPIRIKQISLKNIKMPWINDSLRFLISKKHKLIAFNKQGLIPYETVKLYCKLLKILINRLKIIYFRTKFSNQKDSKSTWKTINFLFNRNTRGAAPTIIKCHGIDISNESEIADCFVKHFVNGPNELCKLIPQTPFNYIDKIPVLSQSFFFSPISTDEILFEANKLKNKRTLDDIPPIFLKNMPRVFYQILSELFNKCVELGHYPTSLKLAKIVPIHKKGVKYSLNNYRAISMLPIINKIFEKLINKRILNYFDSLNLFCDSQYGFRKNRSTEQACLRLITNILNQNNRTVSLFVDFKSAFDTVNHRLLIEKLFHYGVRGNSLKLIESYSSNRQVYVSINSTNSSKQDISIGLPQGSILGPLLFNIYINDISNLVPESNIVIYADDVAVLFNDSDMDGLNMKIQFFLYKLRNWCNFFRLSLNVDKTKMIYFNCERKIPRRVLFNGFEIEIIRSFRYLGYVLDSRLNHKNHLSYLISKMRRLVPLTKKLSVYFDSSSALSFYNSMVSSHLSYGLLVWGGAIGDSSLHRLEHLQIKIILNLFSRHKENSSILSSFNILLLSRMYFLKACLVIHELRMGRSMNYFPLDLDNLTRKHSYSTRYKHNYILPFPYKKSNILNLAYQALKCWNSLPSDVRICDDQFRSRLLMYVRNSNHLPEES